MAASIVIHPSAITGASQCHHPSHSVYEIITARIVAELERGVVPWRRPWSAKLPVNLISQKEYRGLNVLTLGSQGYPSRFWLTFNQATKLGGRIRRGEHASPVIYWNVGEEREYTTRDGETRVSKPFLLRYSNVFNLSQVEGIDLPESALQETRTNDPIEECERIVSGMPHKPAVEQSDKAWYAPGRDVVGMPSIGLFRSSEEFYSTFFHELTHSRATRPALGVMDSSPSNPSAPSRTAGRSSWRRSARRCCAG